MQVSSKILSIGTLALAAAAAQANDGTLDPGFGQYSGVTLNYFDQGGTLLTDSDTASGMARMANGKILIAGNVRTQSGNGDHWEIGLARLNANGNLDNSFAPSGHTLVAGDAVYRGDQATIGCNPDCDLIAYALALGANDDIYIAGQIVINGTAAGLVLHLDSAGNQLGSAVSYDNSFFDTIVVHPDGSEVYAGGARIQQNFSDFDFFLQFYDASLNKIGNSTNAFDEGDTLDDYGRRLVYFYMPGECVGEICTLPTDNLVFAGRVSMPAYNDGFANADVGLLRFSRAIPNGSWIKLNSFAPLVDIQPQCLIGTQDEPRAVTVSADGKILVAGESYVSQQLQSTSVDSSVFFVARLNLDGSLDSTFNHFGNQPGTLCSSYYAYPSAGFYNSAWFMAVQDDGRIVIGGGATSLDVNHAPADMAFTRLLPNGYLDQTFGSTGVAFVSLDGFDGFATQRNEYATTGLSDGAGGILASGARQYSGDDNDYMTVRLVNDDLIFADQFDRTVYSVRP